MKFADAIQVAESSTPSRLKLEKLVVQPLLYGMIFGLGYYVGCILIKSPVLNSFLEEGKNNFAKKL